MNCPIDSGHLSLDSIEAVIFDMDGLLIDSEPIWKRAERESFAEVGIQITEEMATVTATMTTAEVAAHWYAFRPWKGRSTEDLEQAVISRVRSVLHQSCEALPGVHETLHACRRRGWRLALASNSPLELCDTVVNSLNIRDSFDAVLSSEQVYKGKPEPDIYLKAAELLRTTPARCLAVEDSASGVRAARSAGMMVIAVPSTGQTFSTGQFAPHAVFSSLSAFLQANLWRLSDNLNAPDRP